MISLNRMIRPLTCGIILIAALFFITITANAATSTGPFAYITNSGDNTVSVIDTQTNSVIANVTVGNDPGGVAVSPDGTRVYVTNDNSYLTSAGTSGLNEEEGNGTVSVIDAATNTVIATIPLGYLPGGVAVSPDGTRIYVVNSYNNTVSVIDAATNTVIATIPVGTMPDGVAVSPDGTRVYVTNWNSSYNPLSMSPSPYINGTVSVVDTATNNVIATVPVGNWPMGIAASPDGTRIYVTNFNGKTVSVIDAATNAVIDTIPLGSAYPNGVAVNPAGTRIYVANGQNVSVINPQTNTIIANVTVGTLDGADVALTPDGTKLYVANSGNDNVSVIDTATNAVIANISVGSGPSSVGIVSAAPMSTPAPTSTSPSSATPKPSPFVGVEGIGAIVLGAGLYMVRKRN